MGEIWQEQDIELHLGNCLSILAGMKANSIDTLITDPPSGTSFMGKRWDNLAEHKPKSERAIYIWSVLEGLITLGTLQKWEAGFLLFTVDWASEALRVHKPGGSGLVWALPRTSDLTQFGLRLAGYEIRDVIAHVFGTGFPKSHNISKTIDKAAGAEREVVGPSPHHSPGRTSDGTRNSLHKLYRGDGDGKYITAPATDAAQLWDGWGTALKPAREDWILVMKPIDRSRWIVELTPELLDEWEAGRGGYA